MKKLFIILLLFFLVFNLNILKKDIYGKSKITLEKLEETMIDEIYFTYLDLDLTNDEIKSIEYYQDNPLIFGMYTIDGYYQEYNNIKIGKNYFTVKQLEEVFNLNIELVIDDFHTIMEMYYNEEIDFVPGLINNGNREDFFYFAQYNVQTDIYMFDNEYINISDVYGLDNKVIAKETGMQIISDEYIDFLASKGIEITIVEYDNILDAVTDLETNIDYILHSNNVDLIKLGLDFIDAVNFVNAYDLYLSSQKNNDYLNILNAIDIAFDYGLDENSDSYEEKLLNLLFEEHVYFTDDEIAFINDTLSKPVKVTSSSNWIPYVYANDNNEIEGYAYDLFTVLSDNIGLNYDFNFDPNYTWNELLDDMGRNNSVIKYDVAIADSVSEYEDDFATYSYPIRSEEVYVVGLADTNPIGNFFDLQDKKVGIIPYFAATTYLKTNLVFKDFVVYQNLSDMVKGLKSGEIEYFAVVRSEYEGLHFIKKNYDIIPKFTIRHDFDIAILFPKDGDNTEILKKLYNKAIVLSDTTSVSEDYFDMQVDLNKVVQKRTVTTIVVSSLILITSLSIITSIYVRFLRKRMYQDELTKVLNRRSLFKNTKVFQYKYLYYLDLDNFKDINDEFGHKIGDEVLVHITNSLSARSSKKIYRMGGDEFIILSNNIELLDEFNSDEMVYKKDNFNIGVTYSVGAICVEDHQDLKLDQIVRYADFAMYEAKNGGKNKQVFVTNEIISKCDNRNISLKTRNVIR